MNDWRWGAGHRGRRSVAAPSRRTERLPWRRGWVAHAQSAWGVRLSSRPLRSERCRGLPTVREPPWSPRAGPRLHRASSRRCLSVSR